MNSISLDDVPHLVNFSFYPPVLKKKIESYKKLFKKLFKKAKKQGFSIFLNTDIVSENKYIQKYYSNFQKNYIDLLEESLEKIFHDFPVEGIIFRIGESDGNDVKGDFLSTLQIKTPAETKNMITRLIPIFEKNNKYFIFRTWTVGAYPIGDLVWNVDTYKKVFDDIKSENFIISMKYGESDFYRFHQKTLNPLFFEGKHKKILELQTRREREGFGLHPFYIGWEYELYLEQAKKNKNFVGISIWCQTGGWSQHKNVTYLKNSSLWNELNTFATAKIFHGECTADNAIDKFFDHQLQITNQKENISSIEIQKSKMNIFLRKFRDIFISLVYIKGFSEKSLYFRRIRIPPLLWIFWDHVIINPTITLIHGREAKTNEVPTKKEIKEIITLGKQIGIQDIEFQKETLLVLRASRIVLLGKETEKHLKYIQSYAEKYPNIYRFTLPKTPPKPPRLIRWILFFILRKKSQYRIIDHIFLSKWCIHAIYWVSGKFFRKDMPSFVNKQCMDIETIILT